MRYRSRGPLNERVVTITKEPQLMPEPTDTVPEWVASDRGSLWTLALTPLLSLTVWYGIGEKGAANPKPYRVSIFGARSTNGFATDVEAKAFAVRVADRHLALAATQLRAVTG